jgi:hypothetical protein
LDEIRYIGLIRLKIWDNQNDRLLSIKNTGCEIIYIEITLHPKIRFFQANPTPKPFQIWRKISTLLVTFSTGCIVLLEAELRRIFRSAFT